MSKKALEKIAAGHKLIQEGYLLLAYEGTTKSIDPITEEIVDPLKIEKPMAEAAQKVTVDDVRAVLATKTRDGKTQQVKALLNSFGAEKLSSVPEDKLSDLKKKAEVL